MQAATTRQALIVQLAAVLWLALGGLSKAQNLPVAVQFKSLDRVTTLTGYFFAPTRRAPNPAPAIVMLHGRAGPFSTLAAGRYDASTLSKRHQFWGEFWSARGYAALLVDSFSARGYPNGFPIHSYNERPNAVNEVTVRPLDAYGALVFLRARKEVDPARIALQGWSNGGSAALATMADATLARAGLAKDQGFRGALVFYPACGLHGLFDERYVPVAPVRVFSGDNDEEVSAARCQKFVAASQAIGGDIAIRIYPDATHDFDDPGVKRQSAPANAAANADGQAAAKAFMQGLLGR